MPFYGTIDTNVNISSISVRESSITRSVYNMIHSWCIDLFPSVRYNQFVGADEMMSTWMNCLIVGRSSLSSFRTNTVVLIPNSYNGSCTVPCFKRSRKLCMEEVVNAVEASAPRHYAFKMPKFLKEKYREGTALLQALVYRPFRLYDLPTLNSIWVFRWMAKFMRISNSSAIRKLILLHISDKSCVALKLIENYRDA